MRLESHILQDQCVLPMEYAFGIPNAQTHVELGQNRNPPLKWVNLPIATRSLVLICHDPDVPVCNKNVNKEYCQLPDNITRNNFYHWVLVDINPSLPQISDGEFSNVVTIGGKHGPHSLHNTRQGINSYTQWFANDPVMQGKYFGYDGPCPPWNDTIKHRYIFTLYALNIERCPIDQEEFTGFEVLQVIKSYTLDYATLTVTYSLNPNIS